MRHVVWFSDGVLELYMEEIWEKRVKDCTSSENIYA